jgi:uncharacterized protein (TIGR00645 family)
VARSAFEPDLRLLYALGQCTIPRRSDEPLTSQVGVGCTPPTISSMTNPTTRTTHIQGAGQRALSTFIFASRWLQLPLYVGLIVAQCVYVVHFWVELTHLVEAAFGNADALAKLVKSMGYKSDGPLVKLNETLIMLVVLALIDVVMISNLLIMVIVGGYETFVSRLNLQDHPDQPEWLSHVNASVLKVKLAMSIIGISSIHLLKTFINAENYSEKVLIWQTVIHIAFLLSALAIAYSDRVMVTSKKHH